MSSSLFAIVAYLCVIKAEKVDPFNTAELLLRRVDDKIKTINGQFLIFFDNACLDDRGDVVVQQFLAEYECYAKSQEPILQNDFPNEGDYWIVVNKQTDCTDNDGKELEEQVLRTGFCVTAIDEDEEVELSQTCEQRTVESALWNLNQGCPSVDNGMEYLNFNGYASDDLVDIIVMDSGIDCTHPEFAGFSCSILYDAYSGQTMHSHGTHVTGTIMGENYGVLRAKNTNIGVLDVRIFPVSGSTSTAVILNGYEAIITYLKANPTKKAVINMSFGGGNTAEKTAKLQSIRENRGLSIVAAGNDNIDAQNTSPASSDDVITVGAHDINNVRSTFSNYGDVVDVYAPGTAIKSAVVGGGSAVWSGTSMATPFVAGIAATIMNVDPGLEFEGLKSAIVAIAANDFSDGQGRTNLPRALFSCAKYSEFEVSACVNDRDGCADIIDGHYQNCEDCNTYVSCVAGFMYDNRPCAPANPPLVWDDVSKTCEVTSSTCQ